MTRELSLRRQWVEQSEIRSMSIACDAVSGINLSQGVCDMDVPEPVKTGAAKAMEDGYNIYTRYDGLPELRQAIAKKHEHFRDMSVDPESEIIVSAGATGAFYCACLALLNPGDEVILFNPAYGYHISTLAAVQAVPVMVPLTPPDWSFCLADVARAITPATKGILINTPSNPTGKVFSREELDGLAELARRHDLFVFTDEIYEHFLNDGREHVCPASLPGMRERTIVISGLSKTFNITGWRIGYAICDKAYAQTIGYFNDLVYVCAPAPLQIGAAVGLATLGPDYYTGIGRELEAKRDRFCAALTRAGLAPYIPQGAYYVLADMSSIPGRDGKERAMRLLEETGIAAVPGEAFDYLGDGGNLARFCYAKKDHVLDRAIAALDAWRR
jgi:aminotransferase